MRDYSTDSLTGIIEMSQRWDKKIGLTKWETFAIIKLNTVQNINTV
jgi:hypothetical protein